MPLSGKTGALAPLYRNCLFRSSQRTESHDHVSQELVDHVLRWKHGAVDAAMWKGALSQLRMYVLQYGAEVEVTPRPFDDFAIVHTSLAGAAEIETDGRRLEVAEGRVAVLAPRKSVRLRWYPGTQQLILKVPYALLREVGARPEGEDLELSPGFLLPRTLGEQWEIFAQALLNVMSMPQGSALNAAWLDHFERNMALFLLSHQPAALGLPASGAIVEPARDHDSLSGSEGAKRIEAVVEYMESRLCAPISLDDLARVAGVSVRTLNALCHRHRGVAPMELLRNLRLDAVRTRLRLQPDVSVTQTALEFGFGHLGRFSHYYHERFGELPRETQRRRDD